MKKIPWKSIALILFVLASLYYNMKDYYLDVYHILTTISPMSIIILMIYSSIYYSLQGFVFWILTTINNPSYTIIQAIQNDYITLFVNNIFFAATGKVAQLYLFNKQGISPKESPSIVFIEFINFQFVLLLTYAIVFLTHLPFYSTMFSYEINLAFLGLFVTAVVTFGTMFIILFPSSQQLICRILKKLISILPIKLDINNIEDTLQELINHFNSGKDYLFQHKKRWFLIISINILRMFALLLTPFVISQILHLSFTLKDIGTFIALNVLVNLVLSSLPVPGKHGVSESFFIVAFSCIMMDYQAATIMILWRILTYYSNTCIGGILLILNKDIKIKEVKHLDIKPQNDNSN